MAPLEDRHFCAALTVLAAALLLRRPGSRRVRAMWAGILAAGVANALLLSLSDANLVNINVAHHYLGAKYAVPYADFYRVVRAARDEPQVGMRDLRRPPAIVRDDVRAKRAYFIALLRDAGADFDPLAPLDTLRVRALEAGAVSREADGILRRSLPPGRIPELRDDVARAEAELGWGRDLTSDYGFNGSPLYAALRQVDPTLHRRFGRATALLNLAWQVAGALALAWLAGLALGLDLEGRIATAALLFASWDFVGWALPGLVFAGVWLPVALALVAMRFRRAVPAGVAIAWAGLIKLFPFVVLLGPAARLLRGRGDARRWSVRLLVSCAAATIVLGAAAAAGGRSWTGFLHKVGAQFGAETYLMNSVSLAQGLLTLGIHGSPLPRLLAAAAAVVLFLTFPREDGESFLGALPRRSLVLLASAGWLAGTWFNYYAIAPLLLLPLVARSAPRAAAAAAAFLAVSFALPEFDDPMLLAHPVLHALKLAPYVALPAWFVVRELHEPVRRFRVRRVLAVGAACCALAVAGEAWRLHVIRQLDAEAGSLLDRRDAAGALDRWRRLARLDPGNAFAHMNEGIALSMLGRRDEAGRELARAAEMAPDAPSVRQNYARHLLAVGELEPAERELRAASSLAPTDDAVLLDLARTLRREGRAEEADSLVARARELSPGAW